MASYKERKEKQAREDKDFRTARIVRRISYVGAALSAAVVIYELTSGDVKFDSDPIVEATPTVPARTSTPPAITDGDLAATAIARASTRISPTLTLAAETPTVGPSRTPTVYVTATPRTFIIGVDCGNGKGTPTPVQVIEGGAILCPTPLPTSTPARPPATPVPFRPPQPAAPAAQEQRPPAPTAPARQPEPEPPTVGGVVAVEPPITLEVGVEGFLGQDPVLFFPGINGHNIARIIRTPNSPDDAINLEDAPVLELDENYSTHLNSAYRLIVDDNGELWRVPVDISEPGDYLATLCTSLDWRDCTSWIPFPLKAPPPISLPPQPTETRAQIFPTPTVTPTLVPPTPLKIFRADTDPKTGRFKANAQEVLIGDNENCVCNRESLIDRFYYVNQYADILNVPTDPITRKMLKNAPILSDKDLADLYHRVYGRLICD